jgi:hypothetical protein
VLGCYWRHRFGEEERSSSANVAYADIRKLKRVDAGVGC